MSRFGETLQTKGFVVTVEITPPKGVDLTKNLGDLDYLRGVDAVNVTDQNASIMRLGPLALGRLLKERGFESICQFTCRDRNRIALQSDLLSAYTLGLENILCLTGDPTGTGDHPDAKPVFDLDVMGLIGAAKTLESGYDLAGHKLDGAPKFFLGAAANPGAPLEQEIPRMAEKVRLGVQFFQTQAIFDTEKFYRFSKAACHLKTPILAGIIVLKSGNMARYMNQKVPGVNVPQALIDELDQARDKASKGIELATRTIEEVKEMARGVHIMPIGWEKRVPEILSGIGLATEVGRWGY